LIALSKSQEKCKKAQEEWKKYAAFLEANRVDPISKYKLFTAIFVMFCETRLAMNLT
jgi:hypothetical protein